MKNIKWLQLSVMNDRISTAVRYEQTLSPSTQNTRHLKLLALLTYRGIHPGFDIFSWFLFSASVAGMRMQRGDVVVSEKKVEIFFH